MIEKLSEELSSTGNHLASCDSAGRKGVFLINELKFICIVERVPLISAHLLLSTALLLVLNTHKMHLTVRSLATSIADSENHN